MRIGRIIFDRTEAGLLAFKNAGLSFAEICLNFTEDDERILKEVDDLRAAIDKSGLPVSCLGRWNHAVQKDGALIGSEVERYLSLVDVAGAIGAKTFVVGCNYDATASLYKNYTNAIELFGTLCEKARKYDIRVAVQNCNWNNFVVSPREWEVILGELPDLCIKYDPSHAYGRGGDYLAELSNWGDRVAHVHVKGCVKAGGRPIDDPPAGMDDLNWGAIFAILYARGYNGDLSIEPHSKTWKGELAEAGVAFTKNYIEKFIV